MFGDGSPTRFCRKNTFVLKWSLLSTLGEQEKVIFYLFSAGRTNLERNKTGGLSQSLFTARMEEITIHNPLQTFIYCSIKPGSRSADSLLPSPQAQFPLELQKLIDVSVPILCLLTVVNAHLAQCLKCESTISDCEILVNHRLKLYSIGLWGAECTAESFQS